METKGKGRREIGLKEGKAGWRERKVGITEIKKDRGVNRREGEEA